MQTKCTYNVMGIYCCLPKEHEGPHQALISDVLADTDDRSELIERAKVAERRWQEYEREYILPCFDWAEEIGFDLRKAVADNPGHNCVELLVRHLMAKASAAGTPGQ